MPVTNFLRRRTVTPVALSVLVLSMTTAVRTQGKFPPPSFTNLQVMPRDTGAGELVATMKGFTRALGVRCQHCHVGEEGMALELFDFAGDVKPQKATARSMMRMVQEINTRLDAAVPNKSKQARVSCWTCHAGRTTPP